MLVNPDIQAWFQRLQGQPLARGGSAPRGQGIPTYGSDVLSGIVKPGTGMFGFNAPSIMANYRPVQPLPNPAMRGMMGTPPVAPTSAGLAPGMNLGGAAIAAGYEKLGQGAAKAVGDIAAKQKARQAGLDAAAAAGLDKVIAFGTPPAPPARPGEPTPPARPTGLGTPPPTFQPIGTASTTPTLAQPGAGAGETGTAIGPTGSLPTFAQGVPAIGGSDLSTTAAQEAYIRSAASQRGIDPDVAVRVARSEGLGASYAGDKGSSFGPYQLHYGGMAGGGNAVPGLGDQFSKQNPGLHASDPSTVKAQIDFSLDQAAKGGWGPWHGAANVGISRWQGIGGTPGPMQAALSPSSPSSAAYAAAPPSLTGPSQPQLAGSAPTPDTQGLTPQLGPVQHGTYKGQDYTFQAPAGPAPTTPTTPTTPIAPAAPTGAATVPVPPPPPSTPGTQGYNQPQPGSPAGMNPLAAALAQGGNQLTPQIDPTMLAMVLSQPDYGGFGGGGFGGDFGGFGGGDFGGGFSGGDFGGFGGFG